MKEMIKSYKRDLEKIEKRIDDIKQLMKNDGADYGVLNRRLVVLTEMKYTLVEGIYNMTDYLNEINKRVI